MKVEIKPLKNFDFEWGYPSYATPHSAGIDFRAALEYPITIKPLEVQLIPTGLSIHPERTDIALLLLPKSGLGHKKGVILGNSVGLIDADYQGQIMVSVWNRNAWGDLEFTRGDFICQGVFVPVVQAEFISVSEFSDETQRGSMGFGQASAVKTL